MTRYPVWAALVACAALVAGCEPAKELPTDVPKGDGGAVQQPAVPAQSSPEAKKIVDRAAAALTGGKPELLAKGRACRVTLTGTMFSVDGSPQGIETTRTIAAAWPDRFHCANDGAAFGGKLLVEAWLRRPDLVIRGNGADQPATNPVEREFNLASDVVGQLWCVFLLPALDPKAILFDPQTVPFERRDLKLVKVALGEHPVFQMYFDSKTDALLRVEYAVTEGAESRRTEMVFDDHRRDPGGLLLPHRIQCLHNRALREKWAVQKWEFPDTIKDDEFAPPKR